jgi:CHAT domain-containing protein/tetratricopeptide (TPR) repeat protein
VGLRDRLARRIIEKPLQSFLRADDEAAARTVFAEHTVLHAPAVIDLLTNIEGEAQRLGEPSWAARARDRRELLERLQSDPGAGRVDPNALALRARDHHERQDGDRAENVGRALACMEAAIAGFEERGDRTEPWGAAHSFAANFSIELSELDGRDRSEEILRHALAAESAFSRERHRTDWIDIQLQIAQALSHRSAGDRAENHRQALQRAEAARAAVNRRREPEGWANATDLIARLVANSPDGSPTANLTTAIDLLTEALAARDRRRDPEGWAIAQNNLGGAYLDLTSGDRRQNVERAVACFAQAASVFGAEGDLLRWAEVQQSLAHALAENPEGDRVDSVRQAERLFREILEQLPPAWAKPRAECLLNLSHLLTSSVASDRRAAIARAEEAIDEAIGLLDREHEPRLWARAHANLGTVRLKQADPPAADAAVLAKQAVEALEVAEAVLVAAGIGGDDLLGTQQRLATALQLRGAGSDLDRSDILLKSALERTTEDEGDAWWSIANGLGLAAARRAEAGESGAYEEGARQFGRLLQALPATGWDEIRLGAATNLGHMHMLEERWDEAADAYDAGLAAADRLWVTALLTESREAQIEGAGALSRLAAYAMVRAGRSERALEVLELSRARDLGEALSRDRADLEALGGERPDLLHGYERAAEEVRALEDEQRAQGPPSSDAAVTARIGRAREALREAIADIRLVPGLGEFMLAPDAARLRSSVASGCVHLYLATLSQGSIAIAVDSTGIRTGLAPLSATELAEILAGDPDTDAYEGLLFADDDDTGQSLSAELERWLPHLGDQLMGPATELARESPVQDVVLIACGQLGALPLHAAHYPRGGGRASAMDEWDVTYALSTRTLAAARRAHDAEAAVGRGVALGDPTDDLSYAAPEARTVASLLGGGAPLLHERATGAELRDRSASSELVHLACHGSSDLVRPLRSALHLADGPLTVGELMAERSFESARIVVLSACRSGATDIVRLPDEAVGLPAGLLRAGASSVVATLWSVSDLSSALLSVRFWEELLGPGGDWQSPFAPARALGGAQRWLRSLTVEGALGFVRFHSEFRVAGDTVGFEPYLRNLAASWDGEHPFGDPRHWAAFFALGA